MTVRPYNPATDGDSRITASVLAEILEEFALQMTNPALQGTVFVGASTVTPPDNAGIWIQTATVTATPTPAEE